MAPNEIQKLPQYSFTPSFNFCSRDTLATAPDYIRKQTSYSTSSPGTKCTNFADPTCVTYSAQEVQMYWMSQVYPGYCTDTYDSLGSTLDCSGDRKGQETSYDIANRRYCGVKVGGTLTWNTYDDDPTGDLRDMISYFYYTVSTSEEVCPGVVFALTASLGSMAQIELAATLAFGGLLMLLGLLKPVPGHEGSNLMTLLKGAAMNVVDKKIYALEQKVGTGTGDQQKAERGQQSL